MEPVGNAPEAVEAALSVVAARDPVVRAFAHLDADRALDEARRAPPGPLSGLTLGVKDLFDTADQPTSYGSPIYAGHRPRADAAIVAMLRTAGAVVLGKTVTTELALFTPGPTTNPHRTSHTPGGSSSGSAAAVAAGMVDVALGTQTAGSVIRPASFCGVLGLKPTFGLLPTAGVKPVAPSLDTVGLFARDLDVLEQVLTVLVAPGPLADAGAAEPAFALVRTEQWRQADDDARKAVERAARAVGARPRALPPELAGLAEKAALVQAFEGVRSLAWERRTFPELLSAELTGLLEEAARVTPARYAAVVARTARARTPEVTEALFGDADVLVAPAALGEAPAGLASTGSPSCNRLWTLLGLPALSVPGALGATGLPIGVQLVARPFHEAALLRAARQLADALGAPRRPAPLVRA